MANDTDRIAELLIDRGFGTLLGNHPDQRLIESVKKEPDIARKLQQIIDDRSMHWQARFMASEFLLRHVDMTLHTQCDRKSLEESYFQALRQNYTGNGVDWGFERAPDELASLGLTVASWGRDNPTFAAGLDDDRLITMSFVWRIPRHFNPPYRVKDFAALILAKAHGSAIDLAGGTVERDRAIAGFKAAAYP